MNASASAKTDDEFVAKLISGHASDSTRSLHMLIPVDYLPTGRFVQFFLKISSNLLDR